MVGIIAEYNPFHNGHLYHLKKVKELFPNETITLVLAGHFLNRGDISVINKWDKTQLALEYGIDLIVELPFTLSSQASDIYAYGAISILNHLQCNYLVFGSELNNINKLTNYIKDDASIKDYLKQGFNYPTAFAKANGYCNTPNDLLGVSYIKAIKKLNSNIKPISIKRTNDYHSLNLDSKITSATSIRKAYKENKDISNYVPNETLKYIKNISLDDYFLYLKHQIIIDDINKYQTMDEKLANRIKKNIENCFSLDELIMKVKTKNYTYNHIKRSLVHILCGLLKDNYTLEYIRVLGFNKKGQAYLNKIKKEITIPLITHYDKRLDIELQVTKVYALVYGNDIIKKEIQNKPIIKN
ncbi:MAG: nucleotidyltransferase family protein [Bacilli bacterium]